ncbi:MAG TPA: hypothetical protein DCE42_06955 [Myxococcales bacterium]|nr:hypothetical protein [Deltaproteobacteria bacterium]HAA54477.1 hypothetical protein [Myxococcales bacterium]|tara:strand:+ start:23250 stop:23540 length:291 start_codon:yes stop_codon:yes gene_type:complete
MKNKSTPPPTREEPGNVPPEKHNSGMGALAKAMTYWSMIMQMTMSIVIPLLFGLFVDRWLHTAPFFLLVFLLLGCVVAIFVLIRIAQRLGREDEVE